MTDYGRGGVLGAASVLPATSAAGLILTNNAHPLVVAGLLVVSALSFIVLLGSITRFLFNKRLSK